MQTLREQIEERLKDQREMLNRCVESVASAQHEVRTLERILSALSPRDEQLVADLLHVGVLDEPRPF